MKSFIGLIIALLFLSYFGVITIHPDKGYQLIKTAGKALVSEAKKLETTQSNSGTAQSTPVASQNSTQL